MLPVYVIKSYYQIVILCTVAMTNIVLALQVQSTCIQVALAQFCEIIHMKVFLCLNIVMRNCLQFAYNYCTRVTRGVVPIVSVCQQFQSDHTVNQTVMYHILVKFTVIYFCELQNYNI